MSKRKKIRRKINLAAVIPAVLIIAVSVINIILYKKAVNSGADAFSQGYFNFRDSQSEQTYDEFYEAAVEQYKPVYSLITDITTENGFLSVFTAHDTSYIPQEASDSVESPFYIALTCSGTFTVDMHSAEIITDEQRKTVTVRIPRPELTDFTVDFDSAELINTSGIKISSPGKSASEYAHEAAEEDDPVLMEKMLENKVFCENARDAAQKKIIQLIKAENPYEDVTVEVEFIN